MTSSVNWALLGLVIERPSYGGELHKRYERVYGDVQPVSSASHIYSALDALEDRGLIETLDGVGRGRQPKLQYKATLLGIRSYEDWLVRRVDAQRREQELWARQLAIFAHNPNAALHVLGRFEDAYLKSAGQAGSPRVRIAADLRGELIDSLVDEQRRLVVGGMLKWLRYANAKFETLAESIMRDEPPRA